MNRQHASIARFILAPLLVLSLVFGDAPGQANSPRMDQAIWLGLTGRLAAAESLFTLCLGDEGERQAARNNLGNIHLLRGEFDLALACYDAVLEHSPGEAGTILNRGLLEHIAGDTASAARDARIGVTLAGGEEAAADLFGVRHRREESADGRRQGARISMARIRELLALARRAVPGDSLPPGPLRPSISRPAPGSGRPLSLTTSGARGGVEEARVLYWKYGDE